MKNRINLTLFAALLVVIGLACGGGNQQAEANKVVAEANKKLEDARDLFTKTDARNQKLFGADIRTVAEFAAYKERMKDEAKSIIEEYAKASEMLKGVAKNFDDVSRMNVTDKYKEYAKIKSDEFGKRAEAVNIHKGNAQAFVDITNPKDMTARFDENNEKSAKLLKDADELGEKAKKMEQDNKDLFKEI